MASPALSLVLGSWSQTTARLTRDTQGPVRVTGASVCGSLASPFSRASRSRRRGHLGDRGHGRPRRHGAAFLTPPPGARRRVMSKAAQCSRPCLRLLLLLFKLLYNCPFQM